MTGRPATRTRGFGTRLVSGRSRVPFPARGTMTFMSHPSVAVFSGPDQLVAPGLVDAIGEVSHPSPPPSAEWGMRNAEYQHGRRSANDLPPQFRIPHSAFRTRSYRRSEPQLQGGR